LGHALKLKEGRSKSAHKGGTDDNQDQKREDRKIEEKTEVSASDMLARKDLEKKKQREKERANNSNYSEGESAEETKRSGPESGFKDTKKGPRRRQEGK